MLESVKVNLSGERFRVVYSLTGDRELAQAKAQDICLEQTVEFPGDLVPAGDIAEQIVGRIERFDPIDADHYQAEISYAVETSGAELLQLINVIFGNISIKPGIRVESFELPESLYASFAGPRFGIDGLRRHLGVPERPLLCTALKPMGYPAEKLAEFAYQFALGGIDIIKDDHGLADQRFSPFEERIEKCSQAVMKANGETGRKCVYAPNVSGPIDQLSRKARAAYQAGAGALLVSPGLTGMDSLRLLASDEQAPLPLIMHPTFQGSYVTCPDQGLSHFVLYGQLARLAGADASIFPNYGGRFSFSLDECRAIARGCKTPMGAIKPIFPTPGGGMSLERVKEMSELYGNDVIYLIGGNLHRHGGDLVEGSRMFLDLVLQPLS
jgi:ribulose-bisphosphate carboxylase large chain